MATKARAYAEQARADYDAYVASGEAAETSLGDSSLPRRRPAMPFDRITIDPARVNGQPCVRGTRLTVRRVLDLIAIYPDRKDLFTEFPELTEADLAQVLAYASAQLPDRVAELLELK